MSDPTGNLAGSKPQPSEMLLEAEAEAEAEVAAQASPAKGFSFPSRNIHIVGGAAGRAAATFGAMATICVTVYMKKRRDHQGIESHTTNWLPISGFSLTNASKSHASVTSHLSSEAQGLSHRSYLLRSNRPRRTLMNQMSSIWVGGGCGVVFCVWEGLQGSHR